MAVQLLKYGKANSVLEVKLVHESNSVCEIKPAHKFNLAYNAIINCNSNARLSLLKSSKCKVCQYRSRCYASTKCKAMPTYNARPNQCNFDERLTQDQSSGKSSKCEAKSRPSQRKFIQMRD